MTNPGLVERRRKVIENRDVESWTIPGALAEITDQFLSDLYEREISSGRGIALVALGGYGRQELARQVISTSCLFMTKEKMLTY